MASVATAMGLRPFTEKYLRPRMQTARLSYLASQTISGELDPRDCITQIAVFLDKPFMIQRLEEMEQGQPKVALFLFRKFVVNFFNRCLSTFLRKIKERSSDELDRF